MLAGQPGGLRSHTLFTVHCCGLSCSRAISMLAHNLDLSSKGCLTRQVCAAGAWWLCLWLTLCGADQWHTGWQLAASCAALNRLDVLDSACFGLCMHVCVCVCVQA